MSTSRADSRTTLRATWRSGRFPATLGLLGPASVAVVSPDHVSVIMTVLVAAGCYLAAPRSLCGGSPWSRS